MPAVLECGERPYAGLSDKELVVRMLARDGRAWREFQRRFGPRIVAAIRTVTSRFRAVLQGVDVEDIEATFLFELNQRDMYKLRCFDAECGTSLGHWLDVLARRAAYDYLRSAGKFAGRRRVHWDLDELSCAQPDPFRSMCARTELDRVRVALGSLSARDRTLWDLRFLQGHSVERVAAEMDIELESVYKRTHRVRCKLALAMRT
jgi:RNA polymerase sigma factor (sigma-70 family)